MNAAEDYEDQQQRSPKINLANIDGNTTVLNDSIGVPTVDVEE